MKTNEREKTGLGLLPEARLFEQAQGGCQDSLNLLMARHEPLVVYAVNRQNLGDVSFEEAVQVGREGLWHAIQGYDPQRGYQFSTYAYAAIVHQVWAAVKAHCRANQSEHAIQEWAIFYRHWEAGPAQQQVEQERKASLHALVRRMPKRLRRVIQSRYGLAGKKRQTLAEVGRELGVCSERVRQLQVEALVWLRQPAHSQDLRQLLARHSQQDYEWAEEVAQAWLRRRAGRHA